jgi:hypothetical protein
VAKLTVSAVEPLTLSPPTRLLTYASTEDTVDYAAMWHIIFPTPRKGAINQQVETEGT